MSDYSETPMAGISMEDYDTLAHQLHAQIVAVLDQQSYPEGEASKHAWDVLHNSWSAKLTANQWRTRVGVILGIELSASQGG